MPAAAGSDAWCIEEAVREYRLHVAGTLHCDRTVLKVEDGYIVISNDRVRMAISHVRSDGATTPLAVGPPRPVLDEAEAFMKPWRPLPAELTPSAVLGGERRRFEAACGCFLVGLTRAEDRAVLLVAVGRSIGVVHLRDDQAALLALMRPRTLGEIDVDRTLLLGAEVAGTSRGGKDERPPPPRSSGRQGPGADVPRARPRRTRARVDPSAHDDARTEAPSPEVLYEHRRIEGTDAATLDPLITEAINRFFLSLPALLRTCASDERLRGATFIDATCDGLRDLVLSGQANILGPLSRLHAALRDACPGFRVPPWALGRLLQRVVQVAPWLITPVGKRLYLLRNAEAGDPNSPTHLHLCKATPTRGCSRSTVPPPTSQAAASTPESASDERSGASSERVVGKDGDHADPVPDDARSADETLSGIPRPREGGPTPPHAQARRLAPPTLPSAHSLGHALASTSRDERARVISELAERASHIVAQLRSLLSPGSTAGPSAAHAPNDRLPNGARGPPSSPRPATSR